jgi:hypothetical protein
MIFCRHNWVEKKHFIIPSEADMLKEMGLKPNTSTLFKRIYVTDYSCMLCGKLKRLKTTSLS